MSLKYSTIVIRYIDFDHKDVHTLIKCKHGRLHSLDGPAKFEIKYNQDKPPIILVRFYMEGIKYMFDEFNEKWYTLLYVQKDPWDDHNSTENIFSSPSYNIDHDGYDGDEIEDNFLYFNKPVGEYALPDNLEIRRYNEYRDDGVFYRYNYKLAKYVNFFPVTNTEKYIMHSELRYELGSFDSLTDLLDYKILNVKLVITDDNRYNDYEVLVEC